MRLDNFLYAYDYAVQICLAKSLHIVANFFQWSIYSASLKSNTSARQIRFVVIPEIDLLNCVKLFNWQSSF